MHAPAPTIMSTSPVPIPAKSPDEVMLQDSYPPVPWGSRPEQTPEQRARTEELKAKMTSGKVTYESLPLTGRLELIMGCMFAGKSTELMRRARRLQAVGAKVLLVKHALDIRFSNQSRVQTHSGEEMECLVVRHLGEVPTDQAQVFAVDETHFFSADDVCVFYENVVRTQGRTLILAGLHATSDLQPWPSMVQMVPLADDLVMLYAICAGCRELRAAFSKRLTSSRAVVEVGGADKYQAVCRRCYERK